MQHSKSANNTSRPLLGLKRLRGNPLGKRHLVRLGANNTRKGQRSAMVSSSFVFLLPRSGVSGGINVYKVLRAFLKPLVH